MKLHPYLDLPDHRFWRDAVSLAEPFRMDPVVGTRFRIGSDDKVASAGSCFAQHISRQLVALGFDYLVSEAGAHVPPEQRKSLGYGVFSARFGNLYTVRQLLQLLQECLGERTVAESVWALPDGNFVDALRPRVTPGGLPTEAAVHAERSTHLAAVRRMFEQCDVFVFTMGMTEAWHSRVDGTVYPLAPGVAGGSYDPDRHGFINPDVNEIMADLDAFLLRLRSINPAVRVILTVSPVPLAATGEDRHVLVATACSKAVLRVVADMACRRHAWVEYFPSFEIITGGYGHTDYYEADCRNVNELGVDHAMRCFVANFTVAGKSPAPSAGVRRQLEPTDEELCCDEEAINQVRV